MDLKDFIAIRGKSDLFRVISKTPKGIIVETLNDKRTKFKVQPNLHVLMLHDITIFSEDNSDLFLRDIFLSIFKKDGLEVSVSPKSDPLALREFFEEIVPNHDEERVYPSDMKKMIRWYQTIAKFYPQVIEGLAEGENEETEEKDAEESIAETKQENDSKTEKKEDPEKE